MKITPEIQQILDANHPNPFGFLGLHTDGKSDAYVVRTFQPGAIDVLVVIDNEEFTMDQAGTSGFFVLKTRRKKPFSYRLKVVYPGSVDECYDPYSFGQ